MTSNTIQFFTEDLDFNLEQADKITAWLTAVCSEENKPLDGLNYIFCSDEYLLKINQDHLQHDYYTDVISFPYSTEIVEGDIFISIDRVRDNASTHGVDFLHELHRVMVHGLLHFLGYLDKSPEEKLLMTEKEDFYLDQFSL